MLLDIHVVNTTMSMICGLYESMIAFGVLSALVARRDWPNKDMLDDLSCSLAYFTSSGLLPLNGMECLMPLLKVA